jgi:hypothetical protein
MVRTRGQRKQMTSAIPEMTVAEVRRALLEIRTRWKDTTEDHLFFPSDPLFNGLSMESFALMQVTGHHKKRHMKCKAYQSASKENNSE